MSQQTQNTWGGGGGGGNLATAANSATLNQFHRGTLPFKATVAKNAHALIGQTHDLYSYSCTDGSCFATDEDIIWFKFL